MATAKGVEIHHGIVDAAAMRSSKGLLFLWRAIGRLVGAPNFFSRLHSRSSRKLRSRARWRATGSSRRRRQDPVIGTSFHEGWGWGWRSCGLNSVPWSLRMCPGAPRSRITTSGSAWTTCWRVGCGRMLQDASCRPRPGGGNPTRHGPSIMNSARSRSGTGVASRQ